MCARYHVRMSDFTPVCSKTELPPGSTKCVRVGEHRIALYNLDGEYFATQESCTHAEASLCDGQVAGDEVVCPLHFATFSIRTGECTGPPAYEDLQTYPIKIEGDDILVQV
jgi:nitrite reductase/ring-hydroxylating ferredoxin subunit